MSLQAIQTLLSSKRAMEITLTKATLLLIMEITSEKYSANHRPSSAFAESWNMVSNFKGAYVSTLLHDKRHMYTIVGTNFVIRSIRLLSGK